MFMTNEVQITLNIQSSFFFSSKQLDIVYTISTKKKKYKKSFKLIICNIKRKFKKKSLLIKIRAIKLKQIVL